MIREEIWNGEKWLIVTNDEVVLRENSHAVLRGNSHAELWGNSHAELWENSHAVLRGNSHAELWENSHAVLRGNSHAELWGNSHAELWENSHAVLRGNSHAELWENSHAVLRDYACGVKREKTVKIKRGKRATIIIPNYPSKMTEWAVLKGIKVNKGKIRLWKAANKNGNDFYTGKISYLREAVAPDWNPKHKGECGCGLHLADSPGAARLFVHHGDEFRLFEVEANIKDCICFPGNPQYPMKIRARACKFVKEYSPDYVEPWED